MEAPRVVVDDAEANGPPARMMTTPIIKNSPSLAATASRKRLGAFILCVGLMLTAYWPIILRLGHYVLETDYQQHIALVPFISIFLIWRFPQSQVRVPETGSSWLAGIFVALFGIIAASTAWKLHAIGTIPPHDVLALGTLSLLIFVLASALITIGWTVLRPHLFAICFLLFAVPLPDSLIHVISTFLQYTSADAAQVMLVLARTPVKREGLDFHIHGLDFTVAEECSGIRATFVLFMVGLLAAHLLLRRKLNKTLLVASVLPLAILRNGFRIASLTWLTAHVDSRIIGGPLHHRGGPLFFLLGLFPFLALLRWLRIKEMDQSPDRSPTIPKR